MKGIKSIILPDLHISRRGYARVYDTVKDFIIDFKPDVVYLLGDFADNEALCPHMMGNFSSATHAAEIRVLDKELKFLEKHSGKIVWIEGNHEDWVNQYEAKFPKLRGTLTYETQLRLSERNITWIPRSRKKLLKVGKLHMFHGMYINEYHANKHLRKIGCSVVYGHTHVGQVHTNDQVMQRTHKAYGLGCLCNKKASYLKDLEGSWNHEFAVLYSATNGDFNLYPIDIIGNRFYFNGKSYDGRGREKGY